jgi:hypothetical protein
VNQPPDPISDYHWATFLAGGEVAAKSKAARVRKPATPSKGMTAPRA